MKPPNCFDIIIISLFDGQPFFLSMNCRVGFVIYYCRKDRKYNEYIICMYVKNTASADLELILLFVIDGKRSLQIYLKPDQPLRPR